MSIKGFLSIQKMRLGHFILGFWAFYLNGSYSCILENIRRDTSSANGGDQRSLVRDNTYVVLCTNYTGTAVRQWYSTPHNLILSRSPIQSRASLYPRAAPPDRDRDRGRSGGEYAGGNENDGHGGCEHGGPSVNMAVVPVAATMALVMVAVIAGPTVAAMTVGAPVLALTVEGPVTADVSAPMAVSLSQPVLRLEAGGYPLLA
jgi:hypothetical protein